MRTSQVATVRRMWAEGATYAEMSSATGVPIATLGMHIRSHKDEFEPRKHHLEWWREQLATVEGLPCRQAAAIIGTTGRTVCYWRNRIKEEGGCSQ